MAASMKTGFRLQKIGSFPVLHQNGCAMLQQFRLKHKVNIQHPWPGALERQILVKVTNPIIPDADADPSTTCTRRKSLPSHFDIISEYEQFLIKHQRKLHTRNADGILAFFHLGSCTSKNYNKYRVTLKKQDFNVTRLNRKVFYHAAKGTKYETLNAIMAHSTALVYSEEPRVSEMMSLIKKIPSLYLLCAVVEGQLLSKTQVETCAGYPDKLSLLAQTCHTLNQQSQKASQLLTSQQEQLIQNLKTYSESEL